MNNEKKFNGMTLEDFNEKYKDYVEPGFWGLEFDIPEVTDYLDHVFETNFTKIPDFKFSQIKLKFGTARFYSTLPVEDGYAVENTINAIIKQQRAWHKYLAKCEEEASLPMSYEQWVAFYNSSLEFQKNNNGYNQNKNS